MLYAEMGQALRESFNMKDQRAKSKKNKKLNESKSLKEGISYPDVFDELFEYGDESQIFEALINWLPDNMLEDFANEMLEEFHEMFDESLNEALTKTQDEFEKFMLDTSLDAKRALELVVSEISDNALKQFLDLHRENYMDGTHKYFL